MKNKIKKAVLLFISAVMMFSFASCRKTEEKNKDTVLTSFYPHLSDFKQNNGRYGHKNKKYGTSADRLFT